MIEVNGMAHVILTVSQCDKARAFYGELLPFLGLQKVYDGNNFLYHVGGRTAVGIQRCAAEHEGQRFVANRIGLHHFCIRARSREDVDRVAAKLREMGAHIDRGPMAGDWAPGYYYIVFEDPARIPGNRGEQRHRCVLALKQVGGLQNTCAQAGITAGRRDSCTQNHPI